MADPNDGKIWDNGHKIWDGDKPIHRINAPADCYKPSAKGPDGLGYNCGCTKPAHERGAYRILHAIPAWVLVPGGPEREVEGKLVRSFQTWTDVPLFQWHRWYDWNFHVEPAVGYQHVRGQGNEAPNVPGHTPVVPGETIECEWDVGAFGLPSGSLEFGPGPMFNLVSDSSASIDWAWPMTGQYIWLAGRWIYDCGHTNSADRMRSELHPCRALASARWEAAKFSPSSKLLWPLATGALPTAETQFLPAIQFMFFASRKGGYVDFDKLNDRKYEFIVDVPKISTGKPIKAPITATPDANTVVVPLANLIYKVEFPFQNKALGPFGTLDPVVTAIVPDDGTAPNQVKIELPLTSLPANTNACGVLISIGWYDTAGLTAKEVIKCTVRFTEMYFNEDKGDINFKFGVNGRWFWGAFKDVKKLTSIKLNKTISFALPRHQPTSWGGPVSVNSHGAAIRAVGEFMLQTSAQRTLHFVDRSIWDPPGRWTILPEIVRYQEDCVDGNADRKEKVRGAFEIYLFNTLGSGNEALGIFDSSYGVNKDPADLNLPYTLNRSESVLGVEEVGTSAELVQTTSIDYQLFWEADVSLQ